MTVLLCHKTDGSICGHLPELVNIFNVQRIQNNILRTILAAIWYSWYNSEIHGNLENGHRRIQTLQRSPNISC